jgi:hypothetical protein
MQWLRPSSNIPPSQAQWAKLRYLTVALQPLRPGLLPKMQNKFWTLPRSNKVATDTRGRCIVESLSLNHALTWVLFYKHGGRPLRMRYEVTYNRHQPSRSHLAESLTPRPLEPDAQSSCNHQSSTDSGAVINMLNRPNLQVLGIALFCIANLWWYSSSWFSFVSLKGIVTVMKLANLHS